ncbi:MAG: cupin domain-containing protein [Coprobacillus sp.]
MNYYINQSDFGCQVHVDNMYCASKNNQNYRTAFWTGQHLQLTLMSIPVCDEIGLEIHNETDQYIRIEEGYGYVMVGKEQCQMNEWQLCTGEAVFIPAGMWHNIINIGNCPLKLTSVYGPPRHPFGTIHTTKEEAHKK